jgi:type VI secretion system protein ImpE
VIQMNDPDALLRSGDVVGTRAALIEAVRARPGDDRVRMFLFQLLCVTGEWDKARKQLDTLVQVAADAQMLGVTYNQVLEAERLRADVFAGKAQMPVLVGMDGWIEGIADAITLVAHGDIPAAELARDDAFGSAPDTPGTIDGVRFDWIADADMRFGPAFEAIVAGRYGIVPFDAVKSITTDGPRDLRDLLWLPVQIELRSGQSVAAFLPARYPGSEAASDGPIQLGKQTDWVERPWGQAGLGQRLWTLSDESDVGMLGFRELAFD